MGLEQRTGTEYRLVLAVGISSLKPFFQTKLARGQS